MDEYEQRYMQPGEHVLFREKLASRGAFIVSMIFLAAFGIAGLAMIGGGIAGTMPPALGIGVGLFTTLFAAFMGITGVMFSVFRTMLTDTNVHIHFGWTKRKIPLSAITSIRAITLKGIKRGKVQIGLDGVVRTWVGNSPSGRGVEIAYRLEGGLKHLLTIGSEEAERFVETVESARARVRVEASAETTSTSDDAEDEEDTDDEKRERAR